MKQYIDFEIAREYLHKACESLGGNGGMMLKIKFDQEPKADVVEVIHAHWIKNWEIGWSACSHCGKGYLWEDYKGVADWNYCPNCGAKLDEERREDGEIH